MCIIVSKFGGSSTADADCFRRVRAIARADARRRCIVLSAPGIIGHSGEKVTALLDRCWQEREAGRPCGALIDAVAARYDAIARGLDVEWRHEDASRALRRALEVSRAHLLSRGEYLCARLFSKYAGMPMVDAAALVSFDSDGILDCDATAAAFAKAAARHDRFVVPGFYGSDPNGRTEVFSRNGSDITGALAAAGVGAGLYENWSDVPGLMTADPDVVPDARLIPQVSYRQMRRLSRAGARVLHPDSLDPVALAGIPTRLRGTMRPECFGTLVDDRFDRVVPCVAGLREAALPDCTDPVSCVTAFGVTRERAAAIAAAAKALYMERDADCARVYVPRARFEEAVRAAHEVLFG